MGKKIQKNRISKPFPFRKDPKRWNAKRLPRSLASMSRLINFEAPKDYNPGYILQNLNLLSQCWKKITKLFFINPKAEKKLLKL